MNYINTKYKLRSLTNLNKLQNEYEVKLDNQEKSIQDIQERTEELANERNIVKTNILELKEEVLDKENEISRTKRKLKRTNMDIQDVSLLRYFSNLGISSL